MNEYLLEMRNIKYQYKTTGGNTVKAADGVSLAVGRREILGIVGESGSGKTTLGKIACGILPVQSGRIFVKGKIADKPPFPGMQMVFQDPAAALNPRMSVEMSVEEGLLIKSSIFAAERKKMILEILSAVGLRDINLNSYPHQLSGGEKQRIALARVLIIRPRLVVLDEPLSALDATAGITMLRLLMDLRDEFGLSYLLISHNLGAVRQICDRMAVMYLGKIVETGPVPAVLDKPAHFYTQMLISAHLAPEYGKGGLRNDFGAIPDPVALPSGCRFHPRCSAAKMICRRRPPQRLRVGPGHFAYCHGL